LQMHGDMARYQIIPARKAYQVVVTQPNGRARLIRTWPTEEAAMSHLRLLRQRAELIDRQMASAGVELDWHGLSTKAPTRRGTARKSPACPESGA
jgi:hypothetical protein